MEFKIIKVLCWIQFLGLFFLILNHMTRGLLWEPLVLLLIPSSGMLYFTTK
jgi:hypothetical protein